MQSTLAWRSDLYPKTLDSVPVTDFFGAAMPVRVAGTDIVVRLLMPLAPGRSLEDAALHIAHVVSRVCRGSFWNDAVAVSNHAFSKDATQAHGACRPSGLLCPCAPHSLHWMLRRSRDTQRTGQAAAMKLMPSTTATAIISRAARRLAGAKQRVEAARGAAKCAELRCWTMRHQGRVMSKHAEQPRVPRSTALPWKSWRSRAGWRLSMREQTTRQVIHSRLSAPRKPQCQTT